MSQEGDIVGGSGIVLQILQPHIHRTAVYAKCIFEFAEEVEEVVGSQGQLGGLDAAGGEGDVVAIERFGKLDRGCIVGWASRWLRLAILASLQLQRVCEGSLMRADEVGKILYRLLLDVLPDTT
jgi:hypothetical protein